jgi:hypothetical protein
MPVPPPSIDEIPEATQLHQRLEMLTNAIAILDMPGVETIADTISQMQRQADAIYQHLMGVPPLRRTLGPGSPRCAQRFLAGISGDAR